MPDPEILPDPDGDVPSRPTELPQPSDPVRTFPNCLIRPIRWETTLLMGQMASTSVRSDELASGRHQIRCQSAQRAPRHRPPQYLSIGRCFPASRVQAPVGTLASCPCAVEQRDLGSAKAGRTVRVRVEVDQFDPMPIAALGRKPKSRPCRRLACGARTVGRTRPQSGRRRDGLHSPDQSPHGRDCSMARFMNQPSGTNCATLAGRGSGCAQSD